MITPAYNVGVKCLMKLLYKIANSFLIIDKNIIALDSFSKSDFCNQNSFLYLYPLNVNKTYNY